MKPVKRPHVPDHEVLRCIGRGSYGEVWLARGVTGALRAVKVVRREDFELDRTFEREFQGILSFEPISRDHIGLVDILHVGRNVEEGFYFYVMELADDRDSGAKINVVDYEAHTLSSDKARKVKLDLDKIVEIGVSLADALHHLHERGLSHRDIKPSNIIFVQGRAKLADIGLVARSGQQTFVGTEGFFPPEGPGTAQADIYSLGMVLYEISTGNDRLLFPELPAGHNELSERKRRRMLNEVICKACDPSAKRRFTTAKQLYDALKLVRRGKYHRPIMPRAVSLFGLSGLVAFGLVAARNKNLPWPPGAKVVETIPSLLAPKPLSSSGQPVLGSLLIESEPPGAEIYVKGKVIGVTPKNFTDQPEGLVTYKLKLDQYQTVEESVQIEKGENPPKFSVLRLSPPQVGKKWRNSIGMEFKSRGEWHESSTPVTYDHFLEIMHFAPADIIAGDQNAVRVPPEDAKAFCEALLQRDLESGRLEADQHFYRFHPLQMPNVEPPSDDAKDHIVFQCILQKREFGEVIIETDPPGAAIWESGKMLGTTPITFPRHQTGPVDYVIRMLGYEDEKLEGALESQKPLRLRAALKKARQATIGVNFENALGMKFSPVGPILVSIWETRVKDFNAFIAATDPANPHTVSWNQTENDPVARVNRDECQRFCKWLTEKDQAEGLLPKNLEYRLPSDEEWSAAADLPERKQDAPAERNQKAKANYVWGVNVWPPPREKEAMPGNFSDLSRLKAVDKNGKPMDNDVKRELTLEKEKYDDGYAYTSPVGSYVANRFGLYDLAGNVAEWVGDDYGGKDPNLAKYGVTRGGSWADGKEADGRHTMLLASSRNAIKPDYKDSPYGFRCVIAVKPGTP